MRCLAIVLYIIVLLETLTCAFADTNICSVSSPCASLDATLGHVLPGDTILLLAGRYVGALNTASVSIAHLSPLTVAGVPGATVIIDGQGVNNGWQIFNTTLYLSNLVFQNIVSEGALRITNSRGQITACQFLNNSNSQVASDTVACGGGALSIDSSPQIEIRGCLFVGNNATGGQGGAIFANNEDGFVQISDCIFEDNYSLWSGGAVFITNGDAFMNISVSNSSFLGNKALSGGGLAISGSIHGVYAVVSYCTFLNNAATGTDGGGLFFAGIIGAGASVSHCYFAGNTAVNGMGGAVFEYGASFTVTDSIFERNTARWGPALTLEAFSVIYPVALMMDNVTIYDNRGEAALDITVTSSPFAPLGNVSLSNTRIMSNYHDTSSEGIGMSLVMISSVFLNLVVHIDRCVIANNTASEVVLGAGLYIQGNCDVFVSDSVFALNGGFNSAADVQGGAIYTDVYVTLFLHRSIFTANNATIGGGVYNSGRLFVSDSTVFAVNLAAVSGGAIYNAQFANMTVHDSLFEANGYYNGQYTSFGGAVYVEVNSTASVSRSNFTANQAVSGGGFYVLGHMTVSNSVFNDNNATFGGAIALVLANSSPFQLVISSDNVFTENKAVYSGSAFYWTGVDWRNDVIEPINSLPASVKGTPPTHLQIDALNSSVNLISALVTARDYYNRSSIGRYPEVGGDLTILPLVFLLSTGDSGCFAGLSLMNVVNISSGALAFELPVDVVGEEVLLVFASSESSFVREASQFVSMPPCSVGQRYIDTHYTCRRCIECPMGSYNVNGDGICYDCPDNEPILCLGGYNVIAEENAWISYDNTTNSLRGNLCESDNCLPVNTSNIPLLLERLHPLEAGYAHAPGMVPVWYESNNNCAPNATGFMCDQCVANHSMWSGICTDCTNPRYDLLALEVVGYWIYVVFVHIILSGTSSGALVQITIDYFQTAQLVLPPHYDRLLSDIYQLLTKSQRTTECLYMADYYGRYVANLVTPVILFVQLLLAIGVIALLFRYLSGTPMSKSRWLICPALSLGLSQYTPVTDTILSMLRYRTISGYHVLSESPSLLAFDAANHVEPVYLPYYATSLLLVFVVSVGAPIAIIALLLRLKFARKFENPQMLQKYGALYNAYRPAWRWWLVVHLVRRSLLTSLWAIESTAFRPLVTSLVCLLLCVSQTFIRPYLFKNLDNFAAILSTASVAVVSISGLLVSYPGLDPRVQQDMRIFIDVVQVVTLAVLACLIVWNSRFAIKGGYQLVRSIFVLALYKTTTAKQSVIGDKQFDSVYLSAIDKNPLITDAERKEDAEL